MPSALLVDLYELTMARSYVAEGIAERPATFELFFRRLPPGWGYLLAAGIEDALDYLAALRFDADELAFLDITASSEGRDLIVGVVEAVAAQVFIPLTVGGGVRTVEDVRRLLNAGADKVSINTAAVQRPQLVEAAAGRYGSQCIVVAVDAKRVAGPGASRWEVTAKLVLPAAVPGILTGTVLALARALGETAPLILIGGVIGGFSTPDDASIMDRLSGPFTALPLTVFQWSKQPQDEFRELAAAAIVVLLIVTLLANAIAILLRNKYERTW